MELIKYQSMLALLGATILSASCYAGKPLEQQLAEQLPEWLSESDTPSAAVALIEDGQVKWTLVKGEQGPGQVATPETLYNVASLTKPISAEIVWRLAASNKFSLDQPLVKHWVDPDISDDPLRNKLTARLCLSHQCGFPNWRRDKPLKIEFEPGSRASYSGEGYEYVARAVEKSRGQTFETLARETLFLDLGMKDTAFTEQAWFKQRVAMPMGPKGEYGEATLRDEYSATDDLYTTIGDYAKFVASVINEQSAADKNESRWTVNHEQVKQICQPGRLQGDSCPLSMGFSLGWVIMQTSTDTIYFHGGGDWGERSFTFFIPERKFGMVVFTNGAGGMNVIRELISRAYQNKALTAFLTMQAGG